MSDAKTIAWWKNPTEADSMKAQREQAQSLSKVLWQAINDEIDLSARANAGDPDAMAEVAERKRKRWELLQADLAESRAEWAATPRMTPQEIVGGLAWADPIDSETGTCMLCGGFDSRSPELQHKASCEYRHAVALVEEHPA